MSEPAINSAEFFAGIPPEVLRAAAESLRAGRPVACNYAAAHAALHPKGEAEMPGPVSDAYDPEWGTAENAARIREALDQAHEEVSRILGEEPPMYVMDLIDAQLPTNITAVMNERSWRLIRFALERAGESI